jgi:hypothetical protein
MIIICIECVPITYVSVEMSKYQERPSAHNALSCINIAESCRAVLSQLHVADDLIQLPAKLRCSTADLDKTPALFLFGYC